MRCPQCSYAGSAVTDSRDFDNGNTIKRRRVCDRCATRFVTYEVSEDFYIMQQNNRGYPMKVKEAIALLNEFLAGQGEG